MKIFYFIVVFFFALFSSCKKQELLEPIIPKIEISFISDVHVISVDNTNVLSTANVMNFKTDKDMMITELKFIIKADNFVGYLRSKCTDAYLNQKGIVTFSLDIPVKIRPTINLVPLYVYGAKGAKINLKLLSLKFEYKGESFEKEINVVEDVTL